MKNQRTPSLSEISGQLSEIQTRSQFNRWAKSQNFILVFKDTNTGIDLISGQLFYLQEGYIVDLDLNENKVMVDYGDGNAELPGGDWMTFIDISILTAGIHNANLNEEMKAAWARALEHEQLMINKTDTKPLIKYDIDLLIRQLEDDPDTEGTPVLSYSLSILKSVSDKWDDIYDMVNIQIALAKAQEAVSNTVQQLL